MAETQESGSVVARPASFPPDLVEYIQGGGLVRNLPSDELAGRCGADKSRGGRTPYCERAAGAGTDHPTVGRCWQHDRDPAKHGKGLAPWVGEITPEEWVRLTGARPEHAGPEGFQPSHGAEAGLKPFDQILARRLDPEDLEVYLAAPLEPLDVITANLRERMMAKDRIYRYLHKLRVTTSQAMAEIATKLAAETDETKKGQLHRDLMLLKKAMDFAVVEVEPALNRNVAVQARLLEVRARFAELAGAEDQRGRIRDMLSTLNDEDFSRVKSDPVALASLMAAGANLH